jgi:addiction module HigA family antidote
LVVEHFQVYRIGADAVIQSEMALRLAQAFGSTPQHWLQMQLAYDLWQAKRHAKKLHVKQFFAAASG